MPGHVDPTKASWGRSMGDNVRCFFAGRRPFAIYVCSPDSASTILTVHSFFRVIQSQPDHTYNSISFFISSCLLTTLLILLCFLFSVRALLVTFASFLRKMHFSTKLGLLALAAVPTISTNLIPRSADQPGRFEMKLERRTRTLTRRDESGDAAVG